MYNIHLGFDMFDLTRKCLLEISDIIEVPAANKHEDNTYPRRKWFVKSCSCLVQCPLAMMI